MKKYLAIIIGTGLLLTVTGCDNKTKEEDSSKDNTKVEEKVTNKVLSCTQTQNIDIYNMTEDLTFIYDLKGQNLLKTIANYTLELEDEKIDTSSICEEYKNEYLTKCDVKVNNDKIEVALEYDLDKLADKEELFTVVPYDVGVNRDYNNTGITKKTPIEDLKEFMENTEVEYGGTTCTIEEK